MSTLDLMPAAQRMAHLVESVGDTQLSKPTPCPSYTVGDLVDHIGGLALAFTAAARKQTPDGGDQGPSGDASRLSGDWRARIRRDLETLADAWRAPDAWQGMTRIAAMETPGEMVGLIAADELVVHGWDLARATGQDYDCEPELVHAARQFLSAFVNPDMPAGTDVMFGPPQPAPDGASALDEVIALAGRDVNWSAT
ncbi:MAG TPA: TIGR03086 family metal-binding protein [Mycobacteriales bacterium]|nr:TIGR03086 family metal-binding protein [Mycobacteriales bacterium]